MARYLGTHVHVAAAFKKGREGDDCAVAVTRGEPGAEKRASVTFYFFR